MGRLLSYSKILIVIVLVSVEGIQKLPRNFQLTAVSPYCVSISWDPVQYSNGPGSEAVYQYNCNSLGWTNIPNDNEVCGFTPNSRVFCQFRKRGDEDVGTTEVSVYTCSNLFESGSVKFSTPVVKRNSGRKRWKYQVHWEVNTEDGCSPPTPKYKLAVDGDVVLNKTSLTRHTLYADGDVDVNVTVWVIHKNGELSDPVTKVIRTPMGLPPQTAPRNFTMVADTKSPYCVYLNWEPVQYPNGPESGIVYQHKCSSDRWVNVSPDRRVCVFKPNKPAKCNFRAGRGSNNDTLHHSPKVISYTRTTCPNTASSPINLRFRGRKTVFRSGREMWSYRAMWGVPTRTFDCATSYRLEIDGVVVDNHVWQDYGFTRYGGVNVTFKVWLKYKNGVLSTVPATKTFITPVMDLPPPTAPRSFQLTAANSSCVHISWERVEFPKGPESSISYKVRCKDTIWAPVPSSKEICGFQPNELATCQMVASRDSNRATRRHSKIVEASVRTLSEVSEMEN